MGSVSRTSVAQGRTPPRHDIREYASPEQAKDKVKRRFPLNVAVGEVSSVLTVLASEDKSLLVRTSVDFVSSIVSRDAIRNVIVLPVRVSTKISVPPCRRSM